MEMMFENTVWDVPNKWNLKEDYLSEDRPANSVVDGKNILAVVEGVFFVPNGKSRNERFYPKNFWECVLGSEDVKSRLENKLMLGEIGHNDRPVSESDITEGRVSHIVTKLWIDEATNMGMGQTYILGTPAGRNLYTLMKAGCRIKTSSRASGDFKPNETYEGLPIVDENNYYLETFDFVINPGFLETNPLIKENVDKIKKDMETKDMEFGKELLEHVKNEKEALAKEKITLKEDLAVANSKKAELSEKLNLAEAKVAELSEAKELSEKLLSEKQELSEKLQAVSEELKTYKDVCEDASAEELKDSLEKTTNILESYVRYGSPSDIKRKMSEGRELIEAYKEFGKVEDLQETLPLVEHVLEEYRKLGTLEEVKEIITRASELVENQERAKFEDLTVSISRTYKTPIENVRKLLESVGEVETVYILKSISESNKKIMKDTITEDKKPELREGRQNKPLVSEMFKNLNRGKK